MDLSRTGHQTIQSRQAAADAGAPTVEEFKAMTTELAATKKRAVMKQVPALFLAAASSAFIALHSSTVGVMASAAACSFAGHLHNAEYAGTS